MSLPLPSCNNLHALPGSGGIDPYGACTERFPIFLAPIPEEAVSA